MPQYLELPDGSYLELKEGQTAREGMAVARMKFPDIFPKEPEAPKPAKKTGVSGALGLGLESLLSGYKTAAGAITDPEEAARAALQRQAAREEKYQSPTSLERVKQVYEEKGLLPAAGEVLSQIPPAISEQLPQMGALFTGARLGSMAGSAIAPGPGTLVGGVLGAGAALAPSFFGTNIERQAAEQQQRGERINIDRTSAAGAAAIQSLAEGAGTAFTLGGRLVSKLTGIPEKALLIGNRNAQQLAEERLAATLAKGVGTGFAAELPVELIQQMAERKQAGLSLTDQDALNEYGQTAYQVALLSPMGAAGRVSERSGARQQVAEEAKAKAAADRLAAQQAEQKRIADEQARYAQMEAEVGGGTTAAQLPYYESRQMALPGMEMVEPTPTPAAPEEPTDYRAQARNLKAQMEDLQTKAQTTTNLDEKLALFNQFQQLEKAAKEADALVRQQGRPEDARIETLLKEMSDAEKLGDIPTQARIAAQLKALGVQDTSQAPTAQMEMPLFKFKGTSETVDEFNQRVVGPEIGKAREEGNRRALQLQSEIARLQNMAANSTDPEYQRQARQELQNLREIQRMEQQRLDQDTTQQGELFGETEQKVVTGGEQPLPSIPQLLANLRIARLAGNRQAARDIIEDIRAIEDKAPARGPLDTAEAAQPLSGAKMPANVREQQQVSDARATAYAKIVELVSKYNRGAAKADELEAARQSLMDNLIRDIEISRGTPVEQDERREILREANTLVRDLVMRFGDTRTLTSKGTAKAPMFVPAQDAEGRFVDKPVPDMGYPTVESQAPGRQTFAKPFEAAMTIKEGLDDLRNRAVGTQTRPTFTTTFTPEQTTPEMLRAQLDRALVKDPDAHTTEQRSLLVQIADNLPVISSADPERRSVISNWLYRMGEPKPTVRVGGGKEPRYVSVPDALTNDVKEELRKIEEAKRSETETLPSGEVRTAVQEGLFPVEDTATGLKFSTPEAFDKYLASDALQQLRSDLGFTTPTLSRLVARIAPFQKRAAALREEAEMYAEEFDRLQELRREQLKELDEMAQDDLKKETAAIAAARTKVTTAERKLAETIRELDEELASFQTDYLQARSAFELSVKTSEDITAAIQQNVDNFTKLETDAIQQLADAKTKLRQAFGSRAPWPVRPSPEAKVGAEETWEQALSRFVKGDGQVARAQNEVVLATRNLQRMLALSNTQPRVEAFLAKDLDLQMQLAAEAGRMDDLAKSVLNTNLVLEQAKKKQARSTKVRQVLKEAKQEVSQAQEALAEEDRKARERREVTDELERELGFEKVTINHRISEITSNLRVSVKDAAQAEAEMATLSKALMEDAMKIESAIGAQLRAFIDRREKALAQREETQTEREARDNEQRRIERGFMSRLAEMPGERISFEKRRALIEAHGVSEEAIMELQDSIDNARETVDMMRVKQTEAAAKVAELDAQIATLEKQTAKNPRAFKAKLEKNSRLIELDGLREQRAKAVTQQESLQTNLAAIEKEIKTAEAKMPEVLAEKERVEALFANDPEVVSETIDALNKRIEKKTKTVNGIYKKLQEKQPAALRTSRKNDLSKHKGELEKLEQKRDVKRGIQRGVLPALPLETEAVAPGTRLAARKVGPTTKKAVQAGNIRTGEASTTGERKLSTRNKPTQSGQARTVTSLQAQRAANKDVAAEQALNRKSELEDLVERITPALNKAIDAKDTAEIERLSANVKRVQKEIARQDVIVAKATVAPEINVFPGDEELEAFTGNEKGTTFAQSIFTPVAPTVASAIQKGNLLQAVRELVRTTSTGLVRDTASKALPYLEGVKVQIMPGLMLNGVRVPALYSPKLNTVFFDPNGISEENLAHEITHAVTKVLWETPESQLTSSQLQAKREIEKLYNQAKSDPKLENQYGITDAEEFMSEVQSNQKFRQLLDKKPWYNQLFSAIMRFFGFAPRETTSEKASRFIETLYAPAKAQEAESKATTAVMDDLIGKVIQQPKTFREKIGNNPALEAEMQGVDMRAGLRETLKHGDDKLFKQAMYNVLKADQKLPLAYAVLNNGPLETYKDDKGFYGVRSTGKDSGKDVFEAISELPLATGRNKVNVATMYMIAQRALNKGIQTLDFGALGVTEQDLRAMMAEVNANPALKAGLENVRNKYNKYNEGLIKFAVQAQRITQKQADALLDSGDYVPFYRVRDNGTAELVFGDDLVVNVGDIRYQPYLKQLKGGENKILPLDESLYRNTLLLTDAALTNMATKAVAYGMQDLGKATGEVDPKTGQRKNKMAIRSGMGPDDANVIRFYSEPDPDKEDDDGRRWVKIDTEGTLAEGVPAELVVKSMEGAHLPLPSFLKVAGAFSDVLRSGVTRMPPYILRQLIRDPMAASFTGGLNYGPIRAMVKAGKEFVNQYRGTSTTSAKLIEKGLMQSGIFTGDADDMSKIALQIASGKDLSVMDKVFAALDKAALRADASTRALVYENAIKNGLSEVEADMMTMESMNFYKRGLNPAVQYANRLIPFINAQIQGLNVLYKAATGKMPFEEQQKIKQKFFNNAVFLMGLGFVYAMAMDDDEFYKNARPRDKYTNFFLHLPGVEEPIKIPTPFEAGYFFSVSVALVDALKSDKYTPEQWQAVRDMFLNSIPGWSSRGVPQMIKPVFEVFTNKNFMSGAPIESMRQQGLDITERYNASTTEFAKQLSKVLPILSPAQIEHLVRGYLGVAPLVAFSAANSLFAPATKGEAPEARASDMPFFGSMFQKRYGGADADSMYRMAKEAEEARNTFNRMRKAGRQEEAKEFLADHRAEIASAPAAGQYRQLIGRINLDIERVQNRTDMTAQQKRARLTELEKAKQDAADRFMERFGRIESRF